MNLLLILSAILSALTGTGLVGRGSEQPAVVAERFVGEAAAVPTATAIVRPVAVASLAQTLGRWTKLAPAPRSATPLYLARLRR